jgi:hypothetical protein
VLRLRHSTDCSATDGAPIKSRLGPKISTRIGTGDVGRIHVNWNVHFELPQAHRSQILEQTPHKWCTNKNWLLSLSLLLT